MPITHYFSEATLRFFMFFLLNKHNEKSAKIFYVKWKADWRGPFQLSDIVNDSDELEMLLNDLDELGVMEIIKRYNIYRGVVNCPLAADVGYWHWEDDMLIITDVGLFKQKWEEYISTFRVDKLSATQNYFSFAKHEKAMFAVFCQYYQQFNRETFSITEEPKGCRYFEYLWVSQQDGLCVINDIQEQDRNKFNSTGLSTGSILSITLTAKGLKKLQNFMNAKSENSKKEKLTEAGVWKNQYSWENWSVNLDGREVRYKGVLVDCAPARSTAIDTANVALAPKLDLLSVPSNSHIAWSTARISSGSLSAST